MPRLPSEAAKAAKEASQRSGFTPLEPGLYHARLVSVVSKPTKTKGDPMWVWEYEITEEGHRGRKMWNNTVLTDAAMWKVAESLRAFGADESVDTDELIGSEVILDITQRTIGGGARAGEIGNDVSRVLPLDANAAAPATAVAAAPAAAATEEVPTESLASAGSVPAAAGVDAEPGW